MVLGQGAFRFAERETIADLERYGLSLRSINALEVHLGLLYVDELSRVTEEMVLAVQMSGPGTVKELRCALRNWLADQPVKTVSECVEFRGKDCE